MNLIVMLTQNDMTVKNAREVFDSCCDLPHQHWGFKDVGLPKEEMKTLVTRMREAGKTTYLEVVTYTEEKCMEGARLAVECGFDYLMGTLYYQSVADYIKPHKTKYFPFCGKVWGSPSVLGHTEEDIIGDAKKFIETADGTDLLAYRFEGDAEALIRNFKKAVPHLPTVIAGSINSFARLDFMKEIDPWGFTIGSAFFTGEFAKGASFRKNLEVVLEYLGDPLYQKRKLIKAELKKKALESTYRLYDSGLGPVLDGGDLSLKDPETGLIYIDPCTSTGFKIPNWRSITIEDIVVVDEDGKIIDGGAGRKPTVEMPMHLAIYKARPEICGIVHSHALFTGVFAAIGKDIQVPLVETAMFAGGEVRCAEYGRVGSEDLGKKIIDALGKDRKAAILRQHGAVYISTTIDRAFAVAETVERAAQINILAKAMGEKLLLLPKEH
jgi:L-ribulose-5-phosphate 4-epimerase